MKNPYEDQPIEDEIRLGPRGLRIAIVAFFLLVLIPALSLLGTGPGSGALIGSGPAQWRDGLENLARNPPLLEKWRRADQALLSRIAGSGNSRVFAGRDGWLYYRSDLDAVFGKGPAYKEPASVARERINEPWLAPLPVIRDFAEELSKRDIELILVPVPTKPMVCREGLGLPRADEPHAQLAAISAELEDSGMRVLDLFPLLNSGESDEARFLRRDTHWTPQIMEALAREVAGLAQGAGIGRGSEVKTRHEAVVRESPGDLVGMLDLEDGAEVFSRERASLRRVLDAGTGEPLKSDPASEVVVLGDSFVNIFEDPSLGFGTEGEESIGAGFSSHLAAALGGTVHTIAINGGGATSVREAFAGMPADRLQAKKVVVWVLSSRDLLLPEIPARRAGIEWRPVSFKAERHSEEEHETAVRPAPLEIIATLRERSVIEDPSQTPYASAIFSTIFDSVEGREEEVFVFLWAFRERKLEAGAALETGRRYRLRLVPLEDQPEVARATRLDDLFRPELVPYFAESVERVE